MSLFKALRVRVSQGHQFIPDLRAARPPGLRGLPRIAATACAAECNACVTACPTAAVSLDPVAIDLGRCVFCTECVDACPEGKITFTDNPHLGGTSREDLIVTAGAEARTRVRASAAFATMFGRSLRLRQVSAGGCNGCELELNAIANVNFDVQRYGIEWVASPRHADGLVVSGALTRAMHEALRLAWEAMPEPRFVILVGACAISGGLYEAASGVDRTFLEVVAPSLYVPGCPPHPLTFVNAILDLLGLP